MLCTFSSVEVWNSCRNVSISWKHEITLPSSKAEVSKLTSKLCSIFLRESHFRDKYVVETLVTKFGKKIRRNFVLE